MSRRANRTSFTSARAREAARKRWHPPSSSPAEGASPVPPNRDGSGAPLVGPHGRLGVSSGDGVPWTISEARRAVADPKTPPYVRQRAVEWLHRAEQELAARQEPEPTVVRRGGGLV